MEKLTKLNGIGEYELQDCFDCGVGAGPDNENCGNCQKSLDAYQRLGEYENSGLTPEEINRLEKFVDTQAAGLLTELNKLEREIATLKSKLKEEVSRRYQAECNYDHTVKDRNTLRKALELAVEESYGKPAPREIIDECIANAQNSDHEVC